MTVDAAKAKLIGDDYAQAVVLRVVDALKTNPVITLSRDMLETLISESHQDGIRRGVTEAFRRESPQVEEGT